jgi:hypothetical protein
MSSLLTLALSGGVMPPMVAWRFHRPLERVVRKQATHWICQTSAQYLTNA